MSDVLEIQKWSWHQGAQGLDLLVLICISKHADWDTLECYPSQSYVAEQCGISVRKVRAALKNLEDAEIIKRVKRNTKGGRTSDIIVLNAPELLPAAGCSDRAQRHESESPAAQNSKSPAAPRAGKQNQGINISEGNNAQARGNALFPEIETEESPDQASSFEEAWSHWPQKGRERSSRKTSEPVWNALVRKHGKERLLAAVMRYCASPDAIKDGGAYVPALHRWLRDHRWEAWLPPENGALPMPPRFDPVVGRLGADDWQ